MAPDDPSLGLVHRRQEPATSLPQTTTEHFFFPTLRWRRAGYVTLRLALVAACALAAYATHRIVAADTMSDVADLAFSGGALACVIAAIVVAWLLSPAGSNRAVRVAAPLALAGVGIVFAAASYADVMVAAQSLIHSGSNAPPTAIALGPRGDDVRLAGDIQEGLAARLSALLDTHPAVTRIELASEGGLADEGEALREVIAAHELTTYVSDVCESACTLAFVGGHRRLVAQGARLGFHAPFEEGLFGQTFAGDKAAARDAYVRAGVDEDFVEEALHTAPDDMWYPEAARLIAAHVATEVVSRGGEPARGGAVTSARPAPHS